MKWMRIGWILVLAAVLLSPVACVTTGDGDDNGDDEPKPNFVQDTCSGCVRDEQIKSGGTVTGYRFYTYVKNNGGAGKISLTIAAGNGSATKEFTVAAGARYGFTCTVTVQASASSSFTYQVYFPGTPGYTDTHAISGYKYTGGPSDLQLNPR